jgi:succinate dehydrogenase/fumarate reductase flavoprotein subunit
MDPEDNWMIHAADTLREAEFLADYEKVELFCKSAPDAVNELVNWGARFHSLFIKTCSHNLRDFQSSRLISGQL